MRHESVRHESDGEQRFCCRAVRFLDRAGYVRLRPGQAFAMSG